MNVFVVSNIFVIDAIVTATRIVLLNRDVWEGGIFLLKHIKSDRHHFKTVWLWKKGRVLNLAALRWK